MMKLQKRAGQLAAAVGLTAGIGAFAVGGALTAANAESVAGLASARVQVPVCNHLSYEPKEVVIACGDGNLTLQHLHWHSWGSRSATATANYVYNDCKPDCAQGHEHSVRSNAKLYAVHHGSKPYFTRVEVTFPHGGPGGQHRATYSLHLQH